MTQLNEEIRDALNKDKLIDIITTGAKSGKRRTTEIWFTNVGGRIIICGTPTAGTGPGPRVKRDWLANLAANPTFTFVMKESIDAKLAARAELIVDPEERRRLMSAPETVWYREQVASIEELVEGSPIVEIFFT